MFTFCLLFTFRIPGKYNTTFDVIRFLKSSIEWEYCIFGAVQRGEGEGARSFFEGLDMGANTFFEVSNMGARTFFEVEKVGARSSFQQPNSPKPGLGTR